ncbi:MAG: 2,3-bisphosphoglycerate-independent phosphoglycerate mutase [Nitrospinales bacterium]
MKYLVIIGSGLTDQPIAHKDNKTVLQMAETPNLDRLAAEGRTGSVQTVPENRAPGNEVSLLSLLGYDPEKYSAGAGEFVAAGLGIAPKEDEISLCCDFVNLQSSHNDMVMKDYTAGQISSEDAGVLLNALQEQIADAGAAFHSARGYRNVLTLKNPPLKNGLTPPDELIGEGIRQYMPSGAPELVSIMSQAQIILHNHAYNKIRKRKGRDTVNSIWLSGNGPRPALPSFSGRRGLNGAVVAASPLFLGVGQCAGLHPVAVAGATGFMDTDYRGKVDAALRELENRDLVYLHVSAPEMVSMQGRVDDKVLAVEDFDRHVVGAILQALPDGKDVKILLTVNHMCSANLMKYTRDPVPFAVFPAVSGADSVRRFDEAIVTEGSEHFAGGPALMDAFFKGEL